MERRPAAAGVGVEEVCEPGLDAGGLVEERQRLAARADLREPVGVLGGLDLDAGQGGADLLRLDDADRLSVDEEQVVGKAVTGVSGNSRMATPRPAWIVSMASLSCTSQPAAVSMASMVWRAFSSGFFMTENPSYRNSRFEKRPGLALQAAMLFFGSSATT